MRRSDSLPSTYAAVGSGTPAASTLAGSHAVGLETGIQVKEPSAEARAPLISPESMPQQVARIQGEFAVYSESFSLTTHDTTPGFYDITELARAVVQRSTIMAGTLLASTRHTTCAMVIQEHEPLLLSDMADRLRRYAGPDEAYRHNDFNIRTVNMCEGECANGHAHCQHLLLGASVTLPVLSGRLVLGPWQRLFLVELDRSRPRHYAIQVMGVRTAD